MSKSTTSKYAIHKPHIHPSKNNPDTWLVFPDTVFSDLDSLDCNDTISGTCYTNKTLDECINVCANSAEDCETGYYVKGQGVNMCVPLKVSHRRLNPVYRLRNKNIYPIMSNLNVRTFINGKKHPFPPDMANAVFFDDFFQLESVGRPGLRLTPPINEKINDRIEFGKDGINIQFLPYKDTTEKVTVSLPIRYGDNVIINIPGTNLVMLKDDSRAETNAGLRWVSRILSNPDIQNTFKIHSTTRKDGDIAFYGDTIYFTFQDIFLVHYNESSNLLEAVYENIRNHEGGSDNENIYFKLVSRVETYYCENDSSGCLPVNIQDTETDGVKARYKGIPVSRSPSCWGCVSYPLIKAEQAESSESSEYNTTIQTKPNSSKVFLVFGLLLLLLTLVGIFLIWKRRPTSLH